VGLGDAGCEYAAHRDGGGGRGRVVDQPFEPAEPGDGRSPRSDAVMDHGPLAVVEAPNLAPRQAGHVEAGGHDLGQTAGQLVGPLGLGLFLLERRGTLPAPVGLERGRAGVRARRLGR
jgi:hypothetical protein